MKHSSTQYNGICCQGCFRLGKKEGYNEAKIEFMKLINNELESYTEEISPNKRIIKDVAGSDTNWDKYIALLELKDKFALSTQSETEKKQ